MMSRLYVRHARAALTALAAILLVAPAAAAQSSPFVGSWSVEYAAGMRIENDVQTPVMAKGTLTFAEVGDSIVATLKVDPTPGLPPRPEARFAARKVAGSAMTFLQTSQARISGDAEERVATAISTWELKVDGAMLSGTLSRRIEGMDMPPSPVLPVTGKRL